MSNLDKFDFKSKMFGFDKGQVSSYIQKMILEQEQAMGKKQDELALLRKKNELAEEKIDELQKKVDELSEQKTKVADILIAVKEKANRIEQDTIKECEERKGQLEQEISKKVEEKNGIKKEIDDLKVEIVDVLDKYKKQLDSVSAIYKEMEESKIAEDQIS